MKAAAASVAWIAAAVVGQGLITRSAGPGIPLDLALVIVVSVALRRGRVTGLFGGSLAGLAQDALAGDVLGIGGLAKSVVGFMAGVAGTQFIVTHHAARLVVFTGATVAHEVLFTGMSVLLGLRAFDAQLMDLALKALVNALAGVGLFRVVDYLPGARERWRVRREVRRRARFR